MNGIKNTTLAVASIFFAANTFFAMPAHATLIGQTITATGITLTPTTATIGPGVEFIGIIGFMNFDFGASTLTLTPTVNGVGWGGFLNYVFSGFDDLITGLSISSNSGFSGTVVTNFSFGPHSITLDMNAGGAADSRSILIFDIVSSASTVPEPSSMALIGLGLLGLGWNLRKKT